MRRPNRSAEFSAIHDTNNARGAGVIVICTSTKRILLGKRGLLGSNPETWAPFGGMVDDTDTSENMAARRELHEEAGLFLAEDQVSNLPVYVNYGSNGFRFFTFAAFLNYEPQVTINEESSGYAWFRINEIGDLPLHPGFKELVLSDEWEGIVPLLVK